MSSPESSQEMSHNNPHFNYNLLPEPKIKRKYKCDDCDIITVNPREYLRHVQANHDPKIKIVNCLLCQYACRYKQKLNRHLKLVHRCRPNLEPFPPEQIDQQTQNHNVNTTNRQRLATNSNGEVILTSGSNIFDLPLDLNQTQPSNPSAQLVHATTSSHNQEDAEVKLEMDQQLPYFAPNLYQHLIFNSRSLQVPLEQWAASWAPLSEPLDLSMPKEIKSMKQLISRAAY